MLFRILSYINLFHLCLGQVKYFVLHLGEEGDTIPKRFIEKAADYVRLNSDNMTDVQLNAHFFSKTFTGVTGDVRAHLIIDTTKMSKNRKLAAEIASSYGVPIISVNSLNEDISQGMEPFRIRFTPPNLDVHLLIREIAHVQGMANFAVVYQPDLEWNWKSLRDEFTARDVLCVFIKYAKHKQNTISEVIGTMGFRNVFLLGSIFFNQDAFRKKIVFSIVITARKLAVFDCQVEVQSMPMLNNLIYKDIVNSDGDIGLNGNLCIELDVKQMIYGPISFDSNASNHMEYKIQLQCGSQLLATYTNRKSIVIHEPQIWHSLKPKVHYKVLARIKPPFVYSDAKGVYGYSINLLDMIASILNFTYDLDVLKTQDRDYFANTSKDFVKTMLRNGYDIGLGPIFESVYHSSEVQYSIPYYKTYGTTFVIKRFKSDSIFMYITAMDPIVWICILSAYFMSSFLLWAADRTSPDSYKNNKEKYSNDEESREFSVKESLWFCLKSITADGGGILPKHISGRIVAAVWWLFGFIIVASYTANLSASLTMSKMKNPIESFDDLRKAFLMRFAPLENSDEMFYLENMHYLEMYLINVFFEHTHYLNPNVYTRMRHVIGITTYPKSMHKAVDMVLESKSETEGFALIVDSLEARYLVMTHCNLINVSDQLAPRHLSIAVPAYTLLKHDIDKALSIIMRQGLDVELEKKWWDDNPNKVECVQLEDESDGIGIYNMGGVFLIILIGIAASLITMARDYYKYKSRQTTKVEIIKKKEVLNTSRVKEIYVSKVIEDDALSKSALYKY